MRLTMFAGSVAIAALLVLWYGAPPAAVAAGAVLAGAWTLRKSRKAKA
jgi:hypothetical protein